MTRDALKARLEQALTPELLAVCFPDSDDGGPRTFDQLAEYLVSALLPLIAAELDRLEGELNWANGRTLVAEDQRLHESARAEAAEQERDEFKRRLYSIYAQASDARPESIGSIDSHRSVKFSTEEVRENLARLASAPASVPEQEQS